MVAIVPAASEDSIDPDSKVNSTEVQGIDAPKAAIIKIKGAINVLIETAEETNTVSKIL